jgi:hypothetical protein
MLFDSSGCLAIFVIHANFLEFIVHNLTLNDNYLHLILVFFTKDRLKQI